MILMSAVIFNGKAFAFEREKTLRMRVTKLDFTPKMVSLYFTEDPGSVLYTTLKQAAARRVGIDFHAERVSLRDDTRSVVERIRTYTDDPRVHGVMIQKPANRTLFEAKDAKWAGPGMLGTFVKNLRYFTSSEGEGKGSSSWWRRLTAEIPPHKDLDCLTSVNLDRVYRGRWKIVPATVRAVLSILDHARSDLVIEPIAYLQDQDRARSDLVVVVGRSEIVGKPLAHVMAQRGARVTVCASSGVVAVSRGSEILKASKPQVLAEATRQADILVSATGEQGLITGDMVKRGAIVIDVGAPEGDVEFQTVAQKASFITPVPGGVGPMTVVALLENLLQLAG